jgi:hypothetical protein
VSGIAIEITIKYISKVKTIEVIIVIVSGIIISPKKTKGNGSVFLL